MGLCTCAVLGVSFPVVGGSPPSQAGSGVQADSRPVFRFQGQTYRDRDRRVVGPGTDIVVEGASSWRPIVDGVVGSRQGWNETCSTGPHQIGILVVDAAGRESRLAPVTVYCDSEPPVLSWGFEGGAGRGRSSGVSTLPADVAAWTGPAPRLRWSSDSKLWIALENERWHYFADKPWSVYYRKKKARKARPEAPRHRLQGAEDQRTVRVSFPHPRFLLRSQKKELLAKGPDLRLSRSRGIWIEAWDEVCRIERMSFQQSSRDDPGHAAPAPSGRGYSLLVEAVDSVGNRTRVEWPLVAISRAP